MRKDLQHLPLISAPTRQLIREGFSSQDAAQIHLLLALAHPEGGSVPDYPAWLRAFETDAEFDPNLCFTAWDGAQLSGVIQCWTSGFIKDLVVSPHARRQGIALALLNHAFQAFARRGEARVDLKVMENNLPARRLYEKVEMHYVQRSELIWPDLA
ncbi:MAG TPA: GNAT family N-acetyltransferase [Pseudomonas sp.]